MEKKKGTGRIITCLVILLTIFGLFVAQLFNWQLVQGETYRQRADRTNISTIDIEPKRGEILDVNGVDLAINLTGFRIVFDSLYMVSSNPNEMSTSDLRNDVILKLTDLFRQKGEEWENQLPIIQDADGNYAFEADKEKEIAKLKKTIRLNDYATAQQCVEKLASAEYYDCADKTPSEILTITSIRYSMQVSGFNSENRYVFADDVSQEMVAIVEENRQNLPGVFAEEVPIRKYVNGDVAPKIVGHVGAITEKQYKEEQEKNSGKYTINSQYGQAGIENAFEELLVGTKGKKTVESTDSGIVLNVDETQSAQPGNTVYLTIDARLQRVLSKALEENVTGAQAAIGPSENVTGAAVVLNVDDFSVLAAQSYPSYDLTRFMEDDDYKNQISTDKSAPMYDYAFNGGYVIGSTIKPAVALAALQEGAITPSTHITCNHVYTRFADTGYAPKCMGTHGSIDVKTALQKSCNIFFYETGYLTGISMLNEYWRRLGLGEDVGVEISASEGKIAGPDNREGGESNWRYGDTVAASIGQSDNEITILQMATYCATIANNGVRLRTHLVDKITNYDRDTVIEETQPEVVAELGVSEENLKTVQEGMRMVTTAGGTGRVFADYGVAIAGKTGTAQTGGDKPDHELFIGYAPYDDPEIAIALIISYSNESKWSLDVARQIFDAYFYGIGMEEIPETNADGTTSSQTPAE